MSITPSDPGTDSDIFNLQNIFISEFSDILD